ncbi:hypothetical protein P8S55_13165 [Halomonas sp. M1]|uniref:hypothetical protein n=1 Tax=Halomonas sp. M1 TaxID=3035470 RepID=UPI0024856D59|nr:hypothetical protein [Halomonas sp. M1]WFE70726.1 hypothetical protein P8S55_13165 [Halomonas sp. M1]
MKPTTTTISALEVVNDLIPKLNTVEHHIEQMINAVLEASSVPNQIERYSKLQAEFQLELTMIRMNLEHLLKRYRNELKTVMNDPRQDVLLTLDAYEATAIENAKQLYRRVQTLQTQGVT